MNMFMIVRYAMGSLKTKTKSSLRTSGYTTEPCLHVSCSPLLCVGWTTHLEK